MTRKPLVQIQDVNQIFRTGFWLKKTQILLDVNLDVAEGAIFGFIGPNGAGKTTLIHILIGLRKAATGQVLVGGYDSLSREARALIGYLPERPYFHEHLTGRKFLEYMGALSGMSGAQLKKRIPIVLEQVGLSHAENRELRKYSKGMLQRAGIAQAILHDPKLLILDEPMSGLDPIGRKEMRDLILKLSSEGKTIFFTSHVIPDVEAICDSVAMIYKGKITGQGPVEQLLAQGSDQFEIGCSGISREQIESALKPLEVRNVFEGLRVIVRNEDEAQQAIQFILGQKGKIIVAQPLRPSLESYYEAEVKSHV